MRLVLALFALLTITPPASAQSVEPDAVTTKYGEQRAYFQDWLAACRPDGYCSALTYAGIRGELADYVVRVEQPSASPDHGVIYTPVAVIPTQEPTLSVAVDGSEIAVLAPGDPNGLTRAPGDAQNEYRFAAGRVAAEILPAMKAGRFLRVGFTADDGAINRQTFSLRGLGAALAWIAANRMTH